jgi:hypothetical protein
MHCLQFNTVQGAPWGRYRPFAAGPPAKNRTLVRSSSRMVDPSSIAVQALQNRDETISDSYLSRNHCLSDYNHM